MNKILFIWKRDFNSDIELVANNIKDLMDYLSNNYSFYDVRERDNETITIKETLTSEREYIPIKWVKHV